MFIRTLKQKRGEKIYRHVQIVESFRDPAKGNAPRTRILANLGTVEGLGEARIEGGKITHAISRSLPEQTALLETLGVPPLPSSI